MSRSSPSSCRGLARTVQQVLSRPRVAVNHTPAWARAFTPTARRSAEETEDPFDVLNNAPGNAPRPSNVLKNVLSNAPNSSTTTAAPQSKLTSEDHMTNLVTNVFRKVNNISNTDRFNVSESIGFHDQPPSSDEPWHIHIYSHKHNTHVTVSKPNRDAVISMSCGNLGIKKHNRKYYDSAFQLGTYVLERLYQSPHRKDIRSLEVLLRGFGPGREAVVKVLMSDQGTWLRRTIVRVTDTTRLKFGGGRSQRSRRL